MFGMTFTVDSVVQYKLYKKSNHATVFDKTIKSSGTATFSDSAIGVERLRIANEKAVQNNIREFIDDVLMAK